MEIVEISLGKGKADSRDISKRASTCFFHDFPITENDKLGTTWTNMSLFYAWFTLKMPDWGPRNFCLLSGRSQVQLPPRTQIFRRCLRAKFHSKLYKSMRSARELPVCDKPVMDYSQQILHNLVC